jgi:hypothetical protein
MRRTRSLTSARSTRPKRFEVDGACVSSTGKSAPSFTPAQCCPRTGRMHSRIAPHFRRLRIRFERRAHIHEAFLKLPRLLEHFQAYGVVFLKRILMLWGDGRFGGSKRNPTTIVCECPLVRAAPSVKCRAPLVRKRIHSLKSARDRNPAAHACLQ